MLTLIRDTPAAIPAVPYRAIDTIAGALTCADTNATNGRLGEASIHAYAAATHAQRTFGIRHEITTAAVAYHDAIRREHWNTTPARVDAHHQLYLAARGALAIATGD